MSALTPLATWLAEGATLTEYDDFSPGSARLGQPVWGAARLLADLELRLGLPSAEIADAVRVQGWSARVAGLLLSGPRFYGGSYAVDPLGTASALLRMRDELVAAGWNGEAIAGGGERLHALAELEAAGETPPGMADRVRLVEDELRRARTRPFDELHLAEPASVWPARWRRVFERLDGLGVPVRTAEPLFPVAPADTDTDLATVQASLRGVSHPPRSLTGDGSFLLLTGETAGELAAALAALLREWSEPGAVVVRGGERRVLDDAIVSQGLPALGALGRSPWRPAAQILPLAIELAFEPRDPYRLLELLTLPVGPFEGMVGRELARAIARAPGVGGEPWNEAKDRISRYAGESAPDKLARVAEWLECPIHATTAPRSALLAVAQRVRAWLRARFAYERATAEHPARVATLGAAFAQVEAFEEAVSRDPRDSFDLVDARLLFEQVAAEVGLELSAENAGRFDPVDAPAGLRVPRDLVVWWHCVSGTEWRPSVRPWRRAEVASLLAAGIVLEDPAVRLAVEAEGWRRVVLAARKRLVLAVPRWAVGEALDPHPIWDEIVARLGASAADIARVTVEVRHILDGRAPSAAVDVVDPGALALPPPRAEWALDGAQLRASARHSASSLEALVACPLQWVLTYPAGLREGGIASIPRGPRLNGTLGHRLVEALHADGSLRDRSGLAGRLHAHLTRLLREEAAVLLRPGATFELAQLREQLGSSITRLSEILDECRLDVVGVESSVVVSWRRGALEGRLDLLLRDADGGEAILDLKWGKNSYEQKLKAGRAIQLAVYAAARRLATGAREMPGAAYFSLGRGELLTVRGGPFPEASGVEGATLDETWQRLERTVDRVESVLADGRVPVVGVRASLPLLESLGIPVGDRGDYLEHPGDGVCRYCPHNVLCGRRWEVLA